MAVDAIDGDFIPIALASGADCIAIKRYAVLGDKGTEWVHIDELRSGMQRCMSARVRPSQQWAGWELHCLLAMVALCGTDYTRSVPTVGARRIWGLARQLAPIIAGSMKYGNDIPSLAPEAASVFPAIYRAVYDKHVRSADVMGDIARSKLAPSTKAAMPTTERTLCCIQNVNFVLAYWLGHSPDSMSPEYGFREEGGRVAWGA